MLATSLVNGKVNEFTKRFCLHKWAPFYVRNGFYSQNRTVILVLLEIKLLSIFNSRNPSKMWVDIIRCWVLFKAASIPKIGLLDNCYRK